MEKYKLDRISELSKKQRTQGLSEQEKQEQKTLRNEYLAAIRRNFKATLDNIHIVDKK